MDVFCELRYSWMDSADYPGLDSSSHGRQEGIQWDTSVCPVSSSQKRGYSSKAGSQLSTRPQNQTH